MGATAAESLLATLDASFASEIVPPVMPPMRLIEPLTDLSIMTFWPASLSTYDDNAPAILSSSCALATLFAVLESMPAPVEFFITDGWFSCRFFINY